MSLFVRPMQLRDISQVSEIEREAFPPPWPATNFRRDLTVNTSTHYVIAGDGSSPGESQPSHADDHAVITEPHGSRLQAVRTALERLLKGGQPPADQPEFILGFAGVWFLADEAHLATIAVRSDFRQQGVGEHLLIGVIDLAVEHKANLVTLEVRATNESAQALYEKYGFVVVGTRPGYYSDNKEDAILMTVSDIPSTSFHDRLRSLRQPCPRKAPRQSPGDAPSHEAQIVTSES